MLRFLLIPLLAFATTAWSCSAFRIIAADGVTVGCNEDAWRLTPHVWLDQEPGANRACFTGSRAIGDGQYAPQSGMNDRGLVFTRLASHTAERPGHPSHELPGISDDAAFLTEVLRRCATVAEVEDFMSGFDRRKFLGDVLMYVDAAGGTLVVEPYALERPEDESPYLISNFCPSDTPEADRLRLERYRKGRERVQAEPDVAPMVLAEAMSVDRNRLGDGTLLTSLWRPDAMEVTLVFYHDFSEAVTLDLEAEWAAGWKQRKVEGMFSERAGFERLRWHPTPHRFERGREGMAGLGIALAAFALGWVRRLGWAHGGALAWTGAYAVLLAAHQPLFFFDLPYAHPELPWMAWASCSPWGIVALHVWGWFSGQTPSPWTTAARALAVLSTAAFAYWKLFPF